MFLSLLLCEIDVSSIFHIVDFCQIFIPLEKIDNPHLISLFAENVYVMHP